MFKLSRIALLGLGIQISSGILPAMDDSDPHAFLHDDLIFSIMIYSSLDIADVVHFSETNKKINNIINKDELWKMLYLKRIGISKKWDSNFNYKYNYVFYPQTPIIFQHLMPPLPNCYCLLNGEIGRRYNIVIEEDSDSLAFAIGDERWLSVLKNKPKVLYTSFDILYNNNNEVLDLAKENDILVVLDCYLVKNPDHFNERYPNIICACKIKVSDLDSQNSESLMTIDLQSCGLNIGEIAVLLRAMRSDLIASDICSFLKKDVNNEPGHNSPDFPVNIYFRIPQSRSESL